MFETISSFVRERLGIVKSVLWERGRIVDIGSGCRLRVVVSASVSLTQTERRNSAKKKNGRENEPGLAQTEENDATEEEMTRERTTRVGRPRGGTKVEARIGERLRREIGRGRLPRVGDG